MKLTDKRHVLKRISNVRFHLQKEISDHAGLGRVASALANEGFAGGYMAALSDVEAALRHGYPSDHYGYWRRAEAGNDPHS